MTTTVVEAPAAPSVSVPDLSHRLLPWSNLGEDLSDKNLLTAEQAIVEGGLNWEVALKPQYIRINDSYRKVPNRFWVVKESEDILGQVSHRYVPFQNREAFAFTDNLVDSGEAKYIRAGAVAKNRVVFLVMELPKGVTVAGQDEHKMYIVFMTSHNGSKAISAYVTMIRMGCTNQLTFIQNTAPHSWAIPHVADVKGKIAVARDQLNLSFSYADEFVVNADKLAGLTISDDQFDELLEKILPKRPKTDEVIGQIRSLYHNSTTNGFYGTGWGALNAVTEYFDHGRDTRSRESVFFGAMNGAPAKARNAATKRLLALV